VVRLATSDAVTRSILDFARQAYARPLDDARRNALTARVMDALGCAIAASGDAEVRRVAGALGFTGADGPCTALTLGSGPVDTVAFLNGLMVRFHDWNDTYVGRNGGHPSDLIAAALAAGEEQNRSGDEVLRAIAVAQHLMLDMCDGSNALSRGWDHATYVGLAATVACALLRGLDDAQFANALSMIAAANNMLIARSGKVSAWRSLASPQALRNALFVTALARADVSGPDPVFEGRLGFLDVISGELSMQLDPARDRTGDTHLKRFPAVFHAQAPCEIAIKLRAQMGPDLVARIDDIEVATHAFAIFWAGKDPVLWEPENRETADHSIAFMVALALLRGEVHHHDIESGIHDAAVRTLTRKVRVVEDADYSSRWPSQAPARLTVMADGQSFVRETLAGTGHAANPLAPHQRADKLIDNATAVIGEDRARGWAKVLENFATLHNVGLALRP
jgi:2-methylcitrate dehydratase